jgi:hypothetical protein
MFFTVSDENRIIFDSLGWPAKIEQLSTAMTLPPKMEQLLAAMTFGGYFRRN